MTKFHRISPSEMGFLWSVTEYIVVLIVLSFSVVSCGPCALIDSESSPLCISLDEINQAFRQARLAHDLVEPINFSPYKSHHHHHHIDQLGHVLVETSRILAKSLKLDYEQIYEMLPQTSLELTEIWDFCPAQFKTKTCKVSKYRTLSGHCNNINHPDWGAAFTPFRRLLSPDRPDGISDPRDYGVDHSPLPSPRLVSAKIHQDKVVHDHAVTVMLIAWGQIVGHDITFTAETKEPNSIKDPECCSENIYEPNRPKHHNCYPIRIPQSDPFYSLHNHYCMSFTRSFAGVRSGCRLGPRTAFNTISSFLDASFVYGSNLEVGKDLRSGKYGSLRTLPLLQENAMKDLLPLKVDDPDDGCIRPNEDLFCFLAGDNRVNEQLVLTTLHTVFMREHNRIAGGLSEINPHWDDEKLYQETRRIIIAIVQHITFNEFLPMILGRELLHEHGLSVEEGYWTGYDSYTNPGALEEFITSAFRFGHSLLPHKIDRYSTSHHYIGGTKLHEMIRQPWDMFRPGYADSFMMGLVNQLAQVMDEGVTDQVTTLLFKEKGKDYGMDLAAMNIQRGRDHGVPPYAAYRKLCGLPPISHWDDLIGTMRNETVYKYRQIYRSPWDIDLWSGGVSEIPAKGALIGPTFGCLIAKQFHNLRYGDRFWYEIPDLPSSFTLDQLGEIKNMKLSRLFCDNGDALKTIQVYAMVHPDHKLNPRVSCYSQALPKLDLEKWRDASGISNFMGLFTDNQEHESESVLQKAHSYTDLEVIKPPLFDPYFVKAKNEAKSNQTPKKEHESTTKPPPDTTDTNSTLYIKPEDEYQLLLKHVPPFRKIPPDEHKVEKPVLKVPYNNLYGQNVSEYFKYPYGFPPHLSPFPPPGRRRKPSLLGLLRNRNKLLRHIFRRGRKRPLFHITRIRPLPRSPIPGLGGIFSPNPGYLVRQRFHIGG